MSHSLSSSHATSPCTTQHLQKSFNQYQLYPALILRPTSTSPTMNNQTGQDQACNSKYLHQPVLHHLSLLILRVCVSAVSSWQKKANDTKMILLGNLNGRNPRKKPFFWALSNNVQKQCPNNHTILGFFFNFGKNVTHPPTIWIIPKRKDVVFLRFLPLLDKKTI